MTVSAIIPAYNRESTIKRSVDSALAQTYANMEVIVVDDGSTDRTVEVLRSYGDRIRVIVQKNAGPSAARNTGIRAARGEVIAFLDSDDEWLPEKINRQIRLMTNGVTCCICDATMRYSNGVTNSSFSAAGLTPDRREGVWTNPTEVLLSRFLLFNQVVAIRREALNRAGFFPEDLRVMEDYDFALRLSTTGSWSFIADPLVIWHGGAINSLSSAAKLEELPKLALLILRRFIETADGTRFKSHPAYLRRLHILNGRIHSFALAKRRSALSRVQSRSLGLYLNVYEAILRRSRLNPSMVTQAAAGVA